MDYPLRAITLTAYHCTYIMEPILYSGFPKSGFCRNITRDIVYGGLKYRGIGLKYLYTSMVIDHITALVDHTWMNTTTGKLLCTSMEPLKLEVGSSG